MKHQTILDQHQQLRDWSCFQMAPELALKLASVLNPSEYPFQNHPELDQTGYGYYRQPHNIGKHQVTFEEIKYEYPYLGMMERLQEEIDKGNFPVLSLRPAPNQSWHGYVAFEPIGNNDFLILTKKGSIESGNCESLVDTLGSKLLDKEKVDCLFWIATN